MAKNKTTSNRQEVLSTASTFVSDSNNNQAVAISSEQVSAKSSWGGFYETRFTSKIRKDEMTVRTVPLKKKTKLNSGSTL